ncbi:hypothetical protein O181_091675 [Austropuccinia psidii MF-1]|uniref:Uncharacterized protein n=1 Tax=Austropuccinia psidii MF-1 TaxID=1389203 RepID=A0A9Q3P8C8_9BASI|nr:hypothetical protein [Austropuccinia psidii MF-1]
MNWLLHPRLILSNPYHAYTPTPPSRCDSNTAPHLCPHHSLCFHTPAANKVPSQHASNAAYHPYTCVVPSQHASNAACHPSAHVVPSQHAFKAALTLAKSSTLLMIPVLLQHPQN